MTKGKWKVDTPELFNRILEISTDETATQVIVIPLRIFQGLLIEVGERVIELKDKKLLNLMLRLKIIEEDKPKIKEVTKW